MLEDEVLLCKGKPRRWLGLALDAICLDLLNRVNQQNITSKPLVSRNKRIKTYKRLGVNLHDGRGSVKLHVVLADLARVLDRLDPLGEVVRFDGAVGDAGL